MTDEPRQVLTISESIDAEVPRSLRVRTVSDLWDEVLRARTKFPDPDDLLMALFEEVAEGAQDVCVAANLFMTRDAVKGNHEFLQIACVALRLYEEGDPFVERYNDALESGTLGPRGFARRQILEAIVGIGNLAKVMLEDLPLPKKDGDDL